MSSSALSLSSTATPTKFPSSHLASKRLSSPKSLPFHSKPLLFALRSPSINPAPFAPRSVLFASFGDGFVPENDYEDEDVGSEELEVNEEFGISLEDEGEESGGEVEEVRGPRGSGRGGEYGRLYVGNLPYSINSEQLAQVFEEAGRVINVEIVYDRLTDRSRGFGFVTMGSVDEANEAIRMFDGSQVGGRTVKVNFPEVPKGGEREVMGSRIRNDERSFVDSPYKLYAGNLGWGVTSRGLRDAFTDQPGLLSAKVIFDRDSGRSRGFGFVSFESAEAMESALEAMNGEELEGRPLRLNVAADKSSSPPPFERSGRANLDSSELLSSLSN
ncbi:hypothetical protein MLD38_017615 [Melastoma candidum]|uniref:Uncharacterized protein n=1 Tax=Melastoma candidum TaxID=119954 RepID=A0ACB9QT37_9MYRT|nr:hypothetical protein MLD38_017615 [Melastoma candidum]